VRKYVVALLGVSLVLLLGYGAWHGWKRNEPRRRCLETLQELRSALNSPDTSKLRQIILLPAALQGRTPAEQTGFVRKALQDELSIEGLNLLKKEGEFGPLAKLFPLESTNWAAQAGVDMTNCVAFRLDHSNGLRTEVVLTRQPATSHPSSGITYRVLRCNNVKPLPTANQP
jgi:hypothetical protein